jgi:hypothetical protein
VDDGVAAPREARLDAGPPPSSTQLASSSEAKKSGVESAFGSGTRSCIPTFVRGGRLELADPELADHVAFAALRPAGGS